MEPDNTFSGIFGNKLSTRHKPEPIAQQEDTPRRAWTKCRREDYPQAWSQEEGHWQYRWSDRWQNRALLLHLWQRPHSKSQGYRLARALDHQGSCGKYVLQMHCQVWEETGPDSDWTQPAVWRTLLTVAPFILLCRHRTEYWFPVCTFCIAI